MRSPVVLLPESPRHHLNNILAQILACAEAAWEAAGDVEETRRHLDALMNRAEAGAGYLCALRRDGGL